MSQPQPQFLQLLCSRAIEREQRLQVVDETFRGRAHAYIVNFMKLLVEREHFDAFLQCAQWIHQRFNDDNGVVEAHVTSAVALNEDELAALRVKLAHISGRQVKLITTIDPSVIGGVRVEMDETPRIAPLEERRIRLTFFCNPEIQETRKLEFRLLLPDGWSAAGFGRTLTLPYPQPVHGIYGVESMQFSVCAGETVDAENRVVLEISETGRFAPLYCSFVLLG